LFEKFEKKLQSLFSGDEDDPVYSLNDLIASIAKLKTSILNYEQFVFSLCGVDEVQIENLKASRQQVLEDKNMADSSEKALVLETIQLGIQTLEYVVVFFFNVLFSKKQMKQRNNMLKHEHKYSDFEFKKLSNIFLFNQKFFALAFRPALEYGAIGSSFLSYFVHKIDLISYTLFYEINYSCQKCKTKQNPKKIVSNINKTFYNFCFDCSKQDNYENDDTILNDDDISDTE
ncbi:hypothetical protein BpHYR1_019934, partial [Brachionus plicatilis]